VDVGELLKKHGLLELWLEAGFRDVLAYGELNSNKKQISGS
jgi:hypothetical protein